MAHMKVTIDGRTIIDADPKYVGKPPEELQPEQIRKAGKKFKPWQLALASVFSVHAMKGQVSTMVNIDFSEEDWTMTSKMVDGVRHLDITTG